MRGIETSAELLERLWRAGVRTRQDVLQLPGVRENPLAARLLLRFAPDDASSLGPLAETLCTFLATTRLQEKLRILFQVYDLDKDGRVTNAELFEILSLLNRAALPAWKIQNIVDKTLAEAGGYQDAVGFEEFVAAMQQGTLNILSLFHCTEW